MKKIVFLIIVLVLVGGGFFYWWQGHTDERELNKTLPKGIRVDKCLLSGEYRVVNKIDGYEFKIPPEWKGVKEIEYTPEEEMEYSLKEKEENISITSLYAEGIEGQGSILSVDLYKLKDKESDLKFWAQELFQDFGLEGIFENDTVGKFEIVKTKEEKHLGGGYVYFLGDNSDIYVLTCGSEEFVRYIITHGKW